MRLHRLEITAFGPFAGTQVVDFDALAGAGLFLVHGQTGAGKTSVLDAVCFALYGQVPGPRGAARGLHSDHAPPGLGPEVVLETTVRGRRLRITRSPEWERPKKRGSGTTRENARVVVQEYEHGGWTGRTTRIDEAAHLIEHLLGMTVHQFWQVAMLPQGEFAAFLRSGADKRREVLERLFATEVFAQVERWLAERRRQTGRAAEELRAEAESTADRIAELTGARRPEPAKASRPRLAEPADEPADIEVLGPWATELAGQLAAVHDETAAVLAGAEAALAAARTAADRAKALADMRRRYADALRRRDALAGHAAERSELAGRLETAARADRVVPLVRAAADRAGRADRAARRAAGRRAAVAGLVPAQAPEDVLAKAERLRRDEAAALAGRRAEEVRLRAATAELAALAAERDGLAAERAELSAALETLPGRVAELRTGLESARLGAAGLGGAEGAVADAARRLDAAVRRDRVTGLLAAAEDEHRAAVDAAQEARDRQQELRRARLDGMAAELARGLVAGEPCRVCGGTDHPAPAAPSGPAVTAADERRATAAYEQAQASREQAASRVQGHRAELDGLLENAGETPVEALAAAHAAAETAREELAEAAAGAERWAAELARAEAELTAARDRHDTVAGALTAAVTRSDELAAETDRLRAGLAEARGEDPSLEARIRRLERAADDLAEAAAAQRDAETAAGELAAARATAEEAAAEAGFGTAAEAAAAAPPEAERAALRDRIRALDTEEAAVRAVLDDPELAAAAAGPDPEPGVYAARAGAAEAAHTTARSAVDRARRRVDRLAELRGVLDRRIAAWRPAAHRHAVAAGLAAVAGGDPAVNRERMRLSAYVLAARLEQVVAAANERLGRMSSGRYVLRHTVDRTATEKGRRHGTGGLGLIVVDGWTGRERDPATLSGGESFISSLALALGLADVVTAEAGGAEIGTLFVDEGFGTLDEDALDEVMDVLDGLRDGGRAVGVVSHVAELRARIPAHLRVAKTRTGSTVTVAAP
ncbi:SMC family ATPase [Actinomadura craniellae]|uniref:Nuclease SbcCD subunit C n=1 Tax=Actinomadura craniellae TaxID=2231787 RepID=A0A365GY86_9ACTN|nr:SMC family ATPase [Actinomadura craniellae]RAY11772.1 SMC family ATPase [Actinomadura craniellae]